jgi:hypothetical protein
MHQVVETHTYTHVHSEAPSNTDREEVQVHGCNKLASRHVRLELAESRAVPRCDICENAPGTFLFPGNNILKAHTSHLHV